MLNIHDFFFFSLLVLQGYFLSTSRELTRLDSITKAPVIVHFSESISGVMTIRAFGKQKEFSLENIKRVNSNLRMDFHNFSSNAWLGFRLELLGSLIFCISALFMVTLPSNIIKPGNTMTSMYLGIVFILQIFFFFY
jgi:ABC-type multidrug transport system fused ATPase/permease subunit